MALKFLPNLSSDYKGDVLKGFELDQNLPKWAIIWVAVICINLKLSLIFNQEHACFLKIDPVWVVGMHVCVCVCVCVSAPEAISN